MKNCEYNFIKRRVESKHSLTANGVSHVFSVLYDISRNKLGYRLVF